MLEKKIEKEQTSILQHLYKFVKIGEIRVKPYPKHTLLRLRLVEGLSKPTTFSA